MPEGLIRTCRPAVLLAAVAAVLMLVPLDAPGSLHRWHALRHELQDLAHPLLFAMLAVVTRQAVLRRSGRLRIGHYLAITLALAGFGAAIELVQGFAGRDPSIRDLIGDVLGACAGLLWSLRRPAASMLAGLVMVVAALPLLWTIAAYLHRAAQLPVIWRADSALLHRFAHWQAGEFPGLVLDEVPADWSHHRALRLTLVAPLEGTTRLTVRVHDRHHNQQYNDRFNRSFELAGGLVEVEIPMDDILGGPAARRLDAEAIAGIMLFQQAARNEPRVAPLEVALVP